MLSPPSPQGGDGPAPWFVMHPHPSAHGRFAFMSAHFKTCLRFNGAGGFDGKAQPSGPNAACRLYSLGESESGGERGFPMLFPCSSLPL